MRTLKANSPIGRRGQYAKGWRVKKMGKARIIHNKTDYQLTHLLEKGHALSGGGRAEAVEHIAPVERELQKRAEPIFRGKIK